MNLPAPLHRLLQALEAGQLDQAREAARELEKQEGGAAQLAAEVLHELRQPLLGLKAYVQMMRDDGATKLPPATLLAQVERMEQIIADYTRLTSSRPAPREKVSLSKVAAAAQATFKAMPDTERLTVELDAPAEVEVMGNPRLIEQLILNLLSNARDAMGGIGRIKLRVFKDGIRPVLLAADWGPGIPSDLRDKIFEPYVSSKLRGNGLGLAVCKRIAAEHGAELQLVPPSILPDQPPPSTVFRLLFATPESSAATLTSRKKILVVDDELIIRQVFRDLLSKEAEVQVAETGELGMAALSREPFDLIITDKNLPGLSGLDLAQEARKRNPVSRVILMTGYPSLVTAQQAIELGVMDYLEKPFEDIRDVRDKIRAALEAPLPVERGKVTSKRIDVYEDNPVSSKQILEALHLAGMEPRLMVAPISGGDDPPAGVVVSWDFRPALGAKAVGLARAVSRGAPFVVLAEHLTMESALESLRGGAAACLPKLLTDVKALSRELCRALKLPIPP
jgi:CheY-like chemotaxis protein